MTSRNEISCARASLDVGEPLFGSAVSGVERWLLVEHDGPWAPDAIDSPLLPEALVRAIRVWLGAGPGRRFQLIRRPARDETQPAGPRRFFRVEASEGREAITAARVEDAFWQVDGARVEVDTLGDDALASPDWRTHEGRLVLVCTHGKRDACCARLGVPIYQALQDELGDDHPDVVWQTSHVGGHRFAANVVMLPHGYHYGRLDGPVARRIVRGYLRGRLTDLDRLRGRSSHATEVQAAEYWYRQASGQYAIDAVRLLHVEESAVRGVGVTFRDEASDEIHELWVSREATGDVAPPSCGDAPRPVMRLCLDSLRRLAGAENRP